MQYPKPLSRKTMIKRFEEIGLDEEETRFLHEFCLAASHLYGAVNAKNLWRVYEKLSRKKEVVPLTQDNLNDGLELMRRETLRYYIFEADEVFNGETEDPEKRILVSRDLIGHGTGRLDQLYRLFENTEYVGFYVPATFMDHREDRLGMEEGALVEFLSSLVSESARCMDENGHLCENKNRGKKLSEFSFSMSGVRTMTGAEKDLYGHARGNIARHPFGLEEELREISAARRIVYSLKYETRMGDIPLTDVIQILISELDETLGVRLNDEQYMVVVTLAHEVITRTHLWCKSGWSMKALQTAHFRE
ncbi:MAG: hypothetical protein VZR02_08065 [Lachnospiraceae bacterium]|nr:hypothetical protein [Lachnospiraceae bacterium]